MARSALTLIHIGIKNSVVALDAATGAEVWRAVLKGGSFVNVVRGGDRLYAVNEGEMFCLEAKTGAVVWHNPLKGLGRGLATLAGPDAASLEPRQMLTVAEELRRREAAAAAAAAG